MIRTVVTRGFGNGTFAGTIPLVVTRGYLSGEPEVEPVGAIGIENVYLEKSVIGSVYLQRSVTVTSVATHEAAVTVEGIR